MLESYLVPENTTVTAKGDGSPLDISSSQSRVFLLQLKITEVVEQESIDVSIHGAASEEELGKPTPLASFPQKFYCGEHPLLLDLNGHPEVRFLRAHWEVNRWGRGSETPMFAFGVKISEVAPEMLKQAQV
jgi:hypothetical protein